MKKENAEKQQKFFDKQQQEIYNIITGKLRYPPEPFREQDINPDLVIKIKIPQKEYVTRGHYLSLSSFAPIPSQKLERAYARAQKKIAKEMQANRQNTDPLNLRIRLQKAIVKIGVQPKQCKFINQHQEQDTIELQCVHEYIGILDSFTLMYNTMVYTLQRICGFRVKAFVLYNKQVTERHIYLFLSLPTNNLLRIANRYRIKKEVEYTHLDFFLNDPKTADLRPVKLHSKFISDRQNSTHLKHISRYFRVKEKAATAQDINCQAELDDEQLDNFRSCNEQLHILYEYLRYKRDIKLTNNEKMYLFQYNRRKLNPGVQEYYITLKKRKEYFDICKEILPKYGYQTFQEPVVFQQFSIPDKHARGANFFNKLQSILLYKPVITTIQGKMQLFLNMEKTKLCYIAIKKNFKVNFLSLLGIQIFTLQNQFDKYGIGGNQEIKGGLDGENLVDNWKTYSLFSDYKVIRNYMGQRVAYQILYNGYAVGYLMSILVPFIVLFTLEKVFTYSVYLYTSQIQAILNATTYAAYMFYWQIAENQFIKNYCDSVKSQVFLSKFRGPYTRNLVTDQANEFRRPQGFSAYLRNLVCFLLIVALLVILGAIFHGFRMMLVQIYEPLKTYQLGGSLSLPHIIAYGLFFIFQEGFRLIVNKVIQFMIYLQNPPSDEDERQWKDSLTFFYLLAIEMIPPFFLLILEPFSRTSCYANSCEDQLTLYIYSRYVFIVGIVIVKFIWILVFNYIRKNLQKLLHQKNKPIFYQDKLSNLLKNAIADSKKPQHQEDKMNILTNLQNYAIYCTILPISPAIVFLAVFIHFISMRLSLIGDQRRPLNRSQTIIRFSLQLKYIYYLGIVLNSWINIFLLQTVEWYFPDIVERFNTEITQQGIFLLKMFICIFYGIIMLFLGWLAQKLAQSLSQDALNARKDNKFKEYCHSRGGLKITLKKGVDMTPLKNIFRIFNPEKTPEELIQKLSMSMGQEKMDNSESAGSATSLEKKI